MPITSTIDQAQATCTITGRFDAHETPQFRAFFDGLVATDPDAPLHLRVNLANTTFIDSSGLAELVRSMKILTGSGGNLILVQPSDPVMVILELTRLATTFDIETNVAHEVI